MSISPISVKLTFDTDEERVNRYPSVVNVDGRRIIFYEKFFTSGRISGGRVTATLPTFTVNVALGGGILNSTPVVWGATSVTATAEKFEIVYVTLAGVVGITDDFSMVLLKDRIILAYIQSGLSSIVRVIEVEKDGKYIYNRRQVLSGSDWVWDDNEYPLCTGEIPVALYNSGKIYLTYKKDSIAYIRIFNPSDELTWSFLRPIEIDTGNQITLNNDPSSSGIHSFGCGRDCFAQVVNIQLFNLSGIAMTFIRSYSNPYAFKPVISSSYMDYLIGDFTIEFYTKSGSVYTLENSYVMTKYDNNKYGNRWFEWTDTPGQKYVVVACRVSFLTDVARSPYDAYPLLIRPTRLIVENPSPTSILAYVYDDKADHAVGCGTFGSLVKTSEFVEFRSFKEDQAQHAFGCGYLGSAVKTFEYEESRDLENDVGQHSFGCGNRSYCLVANA